MKRKVVVMALIPRRDSARAADALGLGLCQVLARNVGMVVPTATTRILW